MPETTRLQRLPEQMRDNYSIYTLEDEIRADQLCSLLLKQFHRFLLEHHGLEPIQAGTFALGADYFLRDFVISNQRANIFDITAVSIRQFAGHWYIVSNLEPNLAELGNLLKGTEAFFSYCAELQLIDPEQMTAVAEACQDLDYYRGRIESFLDITGDGYIAWEKDVFPC